MSDNDYIFRNSKSIMKRGTGISSGLLYCGRRFTSNGGCSCLSCDGQCGPSNGCPCPDCDCTLAYILYCTCKMNCPFCNSMLLRLNLFNIKNLAGYSQSSNFTIKCNMCNRAYKEVYIPFMFCKKCFYYICPNCAFSQISFPYLKALNVKLYKGTGNGEGILYCGRPYTVPYYCLCGQCNGYCGAMEGCPCPINSLVLAYNIYLNSHMMCGECKNTLLVKTTLIQLIKYKPGYQNGLICNYCRRGFNKLYNSIFHCFKCDFDLCQICAYEILINKKLVFPNLPMKNELPYVPNPINPKLKSNDDNKKEKNNENEEEGDDNTEIKCVICLDNNKCMLAMPCKHVSCCEECIKAVKECPLCRKVIESKIKIYL